MDKEDILIDKTTALLGYNTRHMKMLDVIEALVDKLAEANDRVAFLECLRTTK